MCDDWDSDTSTLLDNTWLRARKAHKCDACREQIPAGHRYHRTSSVLDGSVESWKHCARCWSMIEALWKVNGGGRVQFDLDCGESWEENYGPLPEHVARLAFLTPAEAQSELAKPGGG